MSAEPYSDDADSQEMPVTANMEENMNHPIAPVYDRDSKILILGSFPSVKSREQQFFYGHKQNRFWRVMAQVLECEVPEDIPRAHI